MEINEENTTFIIKKVEKNNLWLLFVRLMIGKEKNKYDCRVKTIQTDQRLKEKEAFEH